MHPCVLLLAGRQSRWVPDPASAHLHREHQGSDAWDKDPGRWSRLLTIRIRASEKLAAAVAQSNAANSCLESSHLKFKVSVWEMTSGCQRDLCSSRHNIRLLCIVEPFYSVVVLCFKTHLQLLQVFRRMLQNCYIVKLQKCFVDKQTLLCGDQCKSLSK